MPLKTMYKIKHFAVIEFFVKNKILIQIHNEREYVLEAAFAQKQ